MAEPMDRETSGVVIVAKNSETAGELGKAVGKPGGGKGLPGECARRFERGAWTDRCVRWGKMTGGRIAIKDCVRVDGAACTNRVLGVAAI